MNLINNSNLSDYQKAGDIIQGTGGVRKYRFAFKNKGKSGSSRVIYVDFVIHEVIYLLTIYSKNRKDDLSEKEKAELKSLVEILKRSL